MVARTAAKATAALQAITKAAAGGVRRAVNRPTNRSSRGGPRGAVKGERGASEASRSSVICASGFPLGCVPKTCAEVHTRSQLLWQRKGFLCLVNLKPEKGFLSEGHADKQARSFWVDCVHCGMQCICGCTRCILRVLRGEGRRRLRRVGSSKRGLRSRGRRCCVL